MKKNKILSADFEESLNLSDDSLVKYMVEDTKNRKIFNGKNKIGGILISSFLIGILYCLIVFSKNGIEGSFEESPIPQPSINFLPMWLFGLLLVTWLTFWLYLRRKSYLNTKVFMNFFNANNFLIWIIIEANLLFLTFFLKPLTIFGIIVLFGLVVLVGYEIVLSKKRALKLQLFNSKIESNKIDGFMKKIISLLMKYGWLIVIIVVLWKFTFPSVSGVRTDIIGFISILALWIVFDIGFIMAEAYLFFPYLLYGYYRYKYPEEYRDWEGKTQIEWYGEKYFNKHIKGTEKEEKVNE